MGSSRQYQGNLFASDEQNLEIDVSMFKIFPISKMLASKGLLLEVNGHNTLVLFFLSNV